MIDCLNPVIAVFISELQSKDLTDGVDVFAEADRHDESGQNRSRRQKSHKHDNDHRVAGNYIANTWFGMLVNWHTKIQIRIKIMIKLITWNIDEYKN